MLRDFHRAHPEIELDVVALFDVDAAIAAVRSGTIDASFRAVTRQLPGPRRAPPAPHRACPRVRRRPRGHTRRARRAQDLDAGPRHRHRVGRLLRRAGRRVRLTIDAIGPNFGTEALLDVIADSSELATFVGEQIRLLWPGDYGLRRIALHAPTPVYPHSLIWRSDSPHPRTHHTPQATSARHGPTPRRGYQAGRTDARASSCSG